MGRKDSIFQNSRRYDTPINSDEEESVDSLKHSSAIHSSDNKFLFSQKDLESNADENEDEVDYLLGKKPKTTNFGKNLSATNIKLGNCCSIL